MSRLKEIFSKAKDSKFIKDLLITVIGQLAVLLVTFGLNKLLSNTVTIAEFGIYNVIKKVSAVAGYIMLIALGIALPKYIPECRERKDDKGAAYYFVASLLIIAFMSLLTIALMVIFRTPLSRLFFGEDGFAKYMLPTAFYSFAVALTTYVYSYYRAVERYYAYNVSQIIVQVLTFLPAIFLYFDLIMLLWVWTAVFSLFSLVILIKALFKFKAELKSVEPKLLLKSGKELLIYCSPRLPGEIVLFAFSLVPLVIVTNKFDLTQSGLFSSAVSVNTALASLFSFVGIILLPSVSKSMVKNDIKSVTKQILVILVLFVALALLMIGFVYLFPEFVIKVLYSEEYFEAIPLMKIIILAILPNALYLLFRNPLDAMSKFPYNTICLVLGFAIMIALMLLSKTVLQCAAAFIIGYCVLGVLSMGAWLLSVFLKKRRIKRETAKNEAESEKNEVEEVKTEQ